MLALADHARQLEGLRVLVVENDPDLRVGVIELLSSEGATVSNAESGNSGLAAFVSDPPDLVLSDLWMPDGDGYDFIRAVRRLPPEQGGLAPAIATSAAENVHAAIMAGFHVFLPKPFDWEALVEIVGDFHGPGKVQPRAPWTLSKREHARVVITFTGRVRIGRHASHDPGVGGLLGARGG